MGKASKKSASKVDAVSPAVVPAKSGKKGTRETDGAIEKLVSAKKQKMEVKTLIKKKKEESSSSEDSSSDSEEEQQVKVPIKKGGAPAKPAVVESSSDETSSDDEPAVKAAVPAKKLPQAVSKNGTAGAPAKKGKPASSSDSSSDSDEDEKPSVKPTLKVTKTAVAASTVSKKKVESSESSESDGSSDEESDEDEKITAVKPKTVSAAPKAKPDSSDTSSESESEEEEAPKTKAAVSLKRPAVTKESKQAGREDDDSEESDEEPQTKKMKSAIPSSVGKPSAKTTVTESSSGESSDDNSEDEEESDEDKPSKTPKKTVSDIEMVDAASPKTNTKQFVNVSDKKEPKTPATPQSTGSKTLFVGNLPFNAEQDDLTNFFKDAGEVVDVRLAFFEDGRARGYGHVEFATVEGAQKALELNNESLHGRPLRLDLAQERGSYTPNTGKESNSFQKGGRGQSYTIFVRGFDNSLGEEEIRSALVTHFGSCGEISERGVRIPVDRETETVRGMAYLQFNDADGFNKALELNGSELGEGYLTVEEAKPRSDNRDGGGDSGRGGWRGSGGRFGRGDGGRSGRSGGRFGGRDGRGRGGRDGGRFGNRGRGRGPSMAAGTGRKTTFDD